MNIEIIENKYRKLIDKALAIMTELNDPVHGLEHMKGVVGNTILLLEKVSDADKEVCLLAAYWHDVGRVCGKPGHGLKSAQMLKEELKTLEYDAEFIEKCYKAIYKHDETDIPDTLEGIVIKDADKIDYLGVKRWKECINRNVRTPRIDQNPKSKLLLDCSKTIYDKKAKEWLSYLESVVMKRE